MVVEQQTENSWQLKAACRGASASAFFPPAVGERKEERLRREALAKAICMACPVRPPCLAYALSIQEPHGIWGGMSELERRELYEREAR